MAGGYAPDVDAIARIHASTIEEATQMLGVNRTTLLLIQRSSPNGRPR
jgi:hypothetical protein